MTFRTMRSAYRHWQSLNSRLAASRETLNHHYFTLLQKAEDCRVDTQRGLLRQSATILQRPLDLPTRQLQERLGQAFALLGKGFFRRSPTALQLDIFRYADRIQAICGQLDQLADKLQTAHKVFAALAHKRDSAPEAFHLALLNPEAAWVTLLLRQRCRLIHHIRDRSLFLSSQTKFAVCQNWLRLLQSLLPPHNLQDLQNALTALAAQIAGPSASRPWSPDALQQLDLCTELARQLVSSTIFASAEAEK